MDYQPKTHILIKQDPLHHFQQKTYVSPQCCLKVNGQTILTLQELKLLGMTFYKKLTKSKHMNKLKTNAMQALNPLKMIVHTN